MRQVKSLAQIVLETGEDEYRRQRDSGGDPYLGAKCTVDKPTGARGEIWAFWIDRHEVGVSLKDGRRTIEDASNVFPLEVR